MIAPAFAARFFDDQDHLGWAAGGGFEYALNNRWSIKAEYLYLDLGSENYTFALGTAPVFWHGGGLRHSRAIPGPA